MVKFTRRNIVKSVASSGIMAGSFTSSTAASPQLTQSVDKLQKGDTRRYFGQAQGTKPVREMRKFLKNKKVKLDRKNISGIRVNPKGATEHVALEMPLRGTQDSDAKLSLRVFDETATASVYLNGIGYKANPATVNPDVNIRSSGHDNHGVVTAAEWGQYRSEQRDEISILGSGCDEKKTVNADGGMGCRFIQAVAAVGGGILLIIPEPSTTAKGAVALSSVLSGGCELHDIVTNHLADCEDFDRLTLCAEYNCRPDPITGVYCEPEVRAYPADGCDD